jgi:hypothetical protein
MIVSTLGAPTVFDGYCLALMPLGCALCSVLRRSFPIALWAYNPNPRTSPPLTWKLMRAMPGLRAGIPSGKAESDHENSLRHNLSENERIWKYLLAFPIVPRISCQ